MKSRCFLGTTAATLSIVLLSQVSTAQEPSGPVVQGEPPAQGVAPTAQPLPPPPGPPQDIAPPPYPYAYPPPSYGPYPGPPSAPFPAGPPPIIMEPRWYGWQTLLSDASAVLLTGASAEVGLGLYVLGGPIVHWSHGNTGRGFASLSLRVGAPLALGALFVATCEPEEEADFGCMGSALLGASLGIVAAIAIDASVVARDTVPIEQEPSLSLGPVRVMPNIVVGQDSASLVLQGTIPGTF